MKWVIQSKDRTSYVGKKLYDACEDINKARTFNSKFEAEQFLDKHAKTLLSGYWKVIPTLIEEKKSLKESYDPTDDVFKRGLAVTMSLTDFIVMTDNRGINLSKHASTYEFRTNDFSVRGKSFTSVSDNLVGSFGKDHSFSIKSKDIEEVRSVIFDNNILSADFVTEEGSVLTIWWEL